MVGVYLKVSSLNNVVLFVISCEYMQMMDDAVYYSGFCKEEQVLTQAECGFMLALKVYSWNRKHNFISIKHC